MFAALLSFFANAVPYLMMASNLLPILALMRSQNDPSVSNAGLNNMLKAIQFVQPLVAQVEAVSNAGATKMTGPEKLQLFQSILGEVETTLSAAGSTSQLAQVMPLLNAAVAAVCAQMKVPGYTTPAVTAYATFQAPTAAPASLAVGSEPQIQSNA